MSFLRWIFGIEDDKHRQDAKTAAREELDVALEEQKQAHESAQQTAKATERVNRALAATAQALKIAANQNGNGCAPNGKRR